MKKQKLVELSSKEQDDLIERIKIANLPDGDKEILTGLIEFNNWLQFSLQEKSMSINRLQNLFFGGKSEKSNRKKRKSKADESGSDDKAAENKPESDSQDEVENSDTSTNSIENTSRNHGRLSHEIYTNAEQITLSPNYNNRDHCPESCGGKLTTLPSGMVVKITGQSFAKITKYKVERLRCNLCGIQVNADMPENVCKDKYDPAFKAQLAMLKYYMGLPFYRIDGYQNILGMPLPDSTQWDLIDTMGNDVYPVFKYLEKLAATGRLLHADDTMARILSNIRANTNIETNNSNPRKGTFTTGILSYVGANKIYLFYSGKGHAGENMLALLQQRPQELSAPQYMCDALSRNIPAELKHILINCLAHGRRKFVEIEEFYPSECGYVINLLSIVYSNDAYTKEQKMNAQQRLSFHQEHSQSTMDTLYSWLRKQLDECLVEDNSSLGKAIKYMLKHWAPLTQFLRIAGAPLDNNILEQALKIPIRLRKNAMFFATEHGAYIGSMLLSLICSCIAAKQNPVEYLTALQVYKTRIVKEPHLWMPWNYLDSIELYQMAA